MIMRAIVFCFFFHWRTTPKGWPRCDSSDLRCFIPFKSRRKIHETIKPVLNRSLVKKNFVIAQKTFSKCQRYSLRLSKSGGLVPAAGGHFCIVKNRRWRHEICPPYANLITLCLDPFIIQGVPEFFANVPMMGKYEAHKKETRYQKTYWATQCSNHSALGDQRPSDLPNDFHCPARIDISENVFRTTYLKKLPKTLDGTLAGSTEIVTNLGFLSDEI